jgi:hypothetical protein
MARRVMLGKPITFPNNSKLDGRIYTLGINIRIPRDVDR